MAEVKPYVDNEIRSVRMPLAYLYDGSLSLPVRIRLILGLCWELKLGGISQHDLSGCLFGSNVTAGQKQQVQNALWELTKTQELVIARNKIEGADSNREENRPLYILNPMSFRPENASGRSNLGRVLQEATGKKFFAKSTRDVQQERWAKEGGKSCLASMTLELPPDVVDHWVNKGYLDSHGNQYALYYRWVHKDLTADAHGITLKSEVAKYITKSYNGNLITPGDCLLYHWIVTQGKNSPGAVSKAVRAVTESSKCKAYVAAFEQAKAIAETYVAAIESGTTVNVWDRMVQLGFQVP